MKKLIIIIAICLLGALPFAHATSTVSVCNMPSAASVQVRIYDNTDAAEDVAWTVTGVTERAVGLSKSCYHYAATLTADHTYQIDWRDAASPTKVASETVTEAAAVTDPWSTALPGAYGVGTAGKILGNYSQGGGDTAVNHNTTSADNLRYTTALGAGISGAVIKAYLKTDYDAGTRTDAFVKGRTVTDVNGRWTNDLYLDGGYTYTILYYKSGSYGPDTKEVTLP